MRQYLTYFFSSFFISLIGLAALYRVRFSTSSTLKKKFLIYSGKSHSSAQLLAGLPIALTIIGMTPVVPMDKGVYLSYMVCAGLITFYGYMDDRFELRPIVKLFAQFVSVFAFSIFSSMIVGGEFSSFIFVVMNFFGVGVLNGTNLLDGLDLMTVKLSTVVYSTFMALGLYYSSPSTITFSMICVGALWSFVFFNRNPSKMHLGEIGGAFLGFTYLFLFTTLFKDVRSQLSLFDAIITPLLPLTLSMGEVGISFFRRLLNGKSPFKGDKFHLHHILHNYKKLSVNQTTNVLALAYAGIFSFCLVMHTLFHLDIKLAYLSSIVLIGAFQGYFGTKFWIKKGFDFSLKNILKSLRKEQLTIIDSSKVDSFEFKIIDGGKAQPTEVGKEVEDDKDAA